jgi:hypothetical protein
LGAVGELCPGFVVAAPVAAGSLALWLGAGLLSEVVDCAAGSLLGVDPHAARAHAAANMCKRLSGFVMASACMPRISARVRSRSCREGDDQHALRDMFVRKLLHRSPRWD